MSLKQNNVCGRGSRGRKSAVSIAVAEIRFRMPRVHRGPNVSVDSSNTKPHLGEDPLRLSFGSCGCVEWNGPDVTPSKVG